MLLISRGSPLSGCLVNGFDGIEDGHGGIEGKKDVGGAGESNYIHGQAGHSGSHEVA